MVQIGQIGGQPVLILPEGTLRQQGKGAQGAGMETFRKEADFAI